MKIAEMLVSAAAAAGLGLGLYGFSGSDAPPPTPAQAASPVVIRVGDTVPAADLHLITHPGLYGLGREKLGTHYAVVGGKLVRVHKDTLQIQSVLRQQTAILD